MAKDRPYQGENIETLEQLHAQNPDQENIQKQLLHELSYRKTEQVFDAEEFSIDYPEITNTSSSILGAWSVMEVLSPSTFNKLSDLVNGDRTRIYRISHNSLPWENGGEKSRPKKSLFYQVILGTIDMSPAITDLLIKYSDTRPERPKAKGNAIIATILLDRFGKPVLENALELSSFAWGVPVALRRNLRKLADWQKYQKQLEKELFHHLFEQDENNEFLPLSLQRMRSAYSWLIETLNLNESICTPPINILRTYQDYKSKEPPETILLNSFFLEDLTKATQLAKTNNLPSILQKYLGQKETANRKNLMSDDTALEQCLQPKETPESSWPGKGRFPLALLQQAAVNIVRKNLKDKNGIVAVNGPPGTGKTTLLKDVIADRLVERAGQLVKFPDPEKVFHTTGQKIKKGQAYIHFYRPDESITGYEMIVASSNNKAVENVSKELPSADAVADDANNLRYFQTTSDTLLGQKTWGIIAGVLGNSSNRYKFKQTFWWDKDVGLQTYLKHAAGSPSIISLDDEYQTERLPYIVTNENAPNNHTEALSRWKTISEEFINKKKAVTKKLQNIQIIRNLLKEIDELQDQKNIQSINLTDLQKETQSLEFKHEKASSIFNSIEEKISRIEEDLRLVNIQKPNWFSQLFKTKKYRIWLTEYQEILRVLKKISRERQSIGDSAQKAKENLQIALDKARKYEKEINSIQQKITTKQSEYEDLTRSFDGTILDSNFFNETHKTKQLSTPWFDEQTSRLRQDLFSSAMAVHKAFIDASAKKIRHNLNALLDTYGMESFGAFDRDKLLPDLWRTLFLIIPVISSTFASVARMFNKIEAESFGWLLVDEAGQALPQAAVGLLMRCKKAVIVGDPMQVEPVVILPETLTEAICRTFGIDPLLYNAPLASTQTLGDAATSHFGTFETNFGSREVGIPLLVHRRCQSPMFDISNAIAYENLMVQGKKTSTSEFDTILGPSKWIDVAGEGNDKWCQAEGEVVLEMLKLIKHANIMPDIYIVTPFVIVADNLRQELENSHILEGWIEKPKSWLYERIGTVHTVQGREADCVLFVLGAPNPDQAGARSWAGSRPNIANVAVTRAKKIFMSLEISTSGKLRVCLVNLSKS